MSLRLTQRAPDGWDSPRFLEIVLSFGSFPFPSLSLPQPPVTQAVSQQRLFFECGYVGKIKKLENNVCLFLPAFSVAHFVLFSGGVI